MATNFPDTSIDNPFVTPPRPWINGDEFDDTTKSGLIYYWNDPVWKTKAGDITVPSLNGGPLAGFRNFIINGDFRIWQRGTSFTNLAPFTSLSRYAADQCLVFLTGIDAGDSLDQAIFTPTFGITTALESNVAGGATFLTLPIELEAEGETAPFIEGETYTVSYYANRDDFNLASIAGINYKNIGAGGDTGTAWTKPAPGIREDVGNGWYRYSQQFVCQACDSKARLAYVARSITDGTQITGFQLEPGPVATPFEHRPIGTELALCQRYYQKIEGDGTYTNLPTGYISTSNVWMPYFFPVAMRATPSASFTGTWSASTDTSPNPAVTGLDFSMASPTSCRIRATLDATRPSGAAANVRSNDGGVVSFKAEL